MEQEQLVPECGTDLNFRHIHVIMGVVKSRNIGREVGQAVHTCARHKMWASGMEFELAIHSISENVDG